MKRAIALLCAMLLPATAGALPARFDALEDPVRPLSRLVGADVVDRDGRRVGEITEVMIDAANKRVAYAVTDSGRWIGIGEARAVVPVPRALVGRDGGPLVIDEGPVRTSGPGQRPELHRGTEILEARVEDYDGRDLGDLRDVLVNLESGAIEHAVIAVDDDRAGAPREAVVGMPAVRLERLGSDDVVLTANRREVDAALAGRLR